LVVSESLCYVSLGVIIVLASVRTHNECIACLIGGANSEGEKEYGLTWPLWQLLAGAVTKLNRTHTAGSFDHRT